MRRVGIILTILTASIVAPQEATKRQSERVQIETLEDCVQDRPAACEGYCAPALVETGLRHQVGEITLAQGELLQSIGGVEDHFGRLGSTTGTLGGTNQHVHAFLETHAGTAGNDHPPDVGLRVQSRTCKCPTASEGLRFE